MHYTKEQILETFKKLPEDVKEAMFSVDTAEIIRNIGEKHKLMIDKIGELADETGLVMLGFTHPSEFISHLAERLEIEKEKAKEIAEEVNSKVFFPIRENLKKIHGVEEAPTQTTYDVVYPEIEVPPPATEPPGLPAEAPAAEAPAQAGIFEAKTKEEPVRSPIEISEKSAEESKKIDPYREPIS